MRRFFLPLLVSAIFVAGGCASAPRGPTHAWLARQGGLDASVTHVRRAEAALTRLTTPTHTLRPQLRISVLSSPAPAAYSWPDGSIFVTRGLVRLLDDHELTAAVAHEIGHLLTQPSPDSGHAVNTLQGPLSARSPEAQADDAGVRLLRACGTPPEAMPNMLTKVVNASSLSDSHTRAIAERIRRLRPS